MTPACMMQLIYADSISKILISVKTINTHKKKSLADLSFRLEFYLDAIKCTAEIQTGSFDIHSNPAHIKNDVNESSVNYSECRKTFFDKYNQLYANDKNITKIFSEMPSQENLATAIVKHISDIRDYS